MKEITKKMLIYCYTDGLLLPLDDSVGKMFDCVVDKCRDAKEK